MKIVTVEELKVWLKFDPEPDAFIDQEVLMLLEGAEQAVLDYITDTFEDFEYPESIKMAVKILAGYFEVYRNAEQEAPVNGNYLPTPVRALLYKYRKPSLR